MKDDEVYGSSFKAHCYWKSPLWNQCANCRLVVTVQLPVWHQPILRRYLRFASLVALHFLIMMPSSQGHAQNGSPEERLSLIFEAVETLPPEEALGAIKTYLVDPELIVSLGATVAIAQISDQVPVEASLVLLEHAETTDNEIEALEAIRTVLRLSADRSGAFLPYAGALRDASHNLVDRAQAAENGELLSLALGLEARAETLLSLRLKDRIETVLEPLEKYLQYLSPLLVLLAWYAVTGLTYLLRPLSVPYLGRLESFAVESEIPIVGSLAGLLALARRMSKRPRVVDAWVRRNGANYMASFNSQPSAKERLIVIPLPIEVDGTLRIAWQPNDLGALSQQERLRILVSGEGGSGKTHTALRIARAFATAPAGLESPRFQRIPVLIGREIEAIGEGVNSAEMLVEMVTSELSTALPAVSIAPDFVHILLATGRLLVIFDGVSEYTASVRDALQPDSPTFPAQAVIVTTRDKHYATMKPDMQLSPARISGSALPSFLDSYMTEAGLRAHVSDHALLRASYRLSGLGQQRSVTPLLARLFALQLAKGDMSETDRLSAAEIMLSYVKGLNDGAGDTGMDTRALFSAASSLANVAVFPTLQPAAIPWDCAAEAVSGETNLMVLKERLTLIQSVGLTEDRLAFVLDPIAEYLAALHLVDRNGKDASKWRDTFEEMEHKGVDPRAAEGFLIAINEVFAYRLSESSPALLQDEAGQSDSVIAKWLREAAQAENDAPHSAVTEAI